MWNRLHLQDENICPIYGHTQEVISNIGKNLIVGKLAGMAISSQGRITSSSYDVYIVKTKAGQKYIGSANGESFGTYWAEFENYPSGGDYSINGARQSGNIAVATIDGYIAMRFAQDATKPQIELGETITAYEPPTPETYTIDLNGTRYGGTLDVIEGKLTNTDGYIASYNGETLPSTWISDRDEYAEGTTPTIGAQVVYKLATPTTVTLTPTQITALKGENNVSSSTGDIVECKYTKMHTWDDIKALIGE